MRVFLLLISLSCCAFLYGQSKIDSLEIVIESSSIDADRIAASKTLALHYLVQDGDKALEYANTGIKLAKKRNPDQGLFFVHMKKDLETKMGVERRC